MSRHSLPLRDSLPHVSSPLRRKSMLNRSGSSSSTLVQNDDDAERRELRRNAELEMRQREVTPSSSEKRRSIGSSIAELSAAQLAEHYANCIKLSAENKINAKNAFSLQLIDYMAMMLKKRDSKMDNFQVASCTLDASTKIYAYRVDCVHTDVLKMAGGLAAGARKKHAEQDEGDEGIGEEPAEGAETVRPKRKARKAKSTVALNVDSINGKLDLNHDMDPFFIHSAGSLGDCQPGDCHFLAGLKICSNYALALDSCLPYWCQGVRSEFADLKTPLSTFPDFKNKTFCPAFEEFTFSNWSLEKEADTLTPPAAAGMPPVDDDYVFDVNAPPEPIPEPEPTDVEPEHFEIAGVDDYQDSEDEEEVAPACQVKHRRPAAIVDLRKHLSLTPREYSYFRAGALDLWAGPSHWKPKPYRDRGTSTEEQNKDGSAATAITKQKKQKKSLVLQFDELEAVMRKMEKTSLAVRLTRQTLKKWSAERIGNPLDMFYDLSRFTQLEFLKHIAVSIPTDDDDDSVVDTPAYNYDNDNDAEEYCPNVIEDDYDDDYCEERVGPDGVPLPTQFQDVHNATTQLATLDEFAGDNLVAPPSKVSRIFIPYAMQAKKMDMKRLKLCIWNLLTESDSEKGPVENDLRVENPKKLSFIYSQLPLKLSAKMAENLSPHLAICALLHLANERNLCIIDQEDLADLTISQF